MSGKILMPEILFSGDRLKGNKVQQSTRLLKDLNTIFKNDEAFKIMNPDLPVYEVDCYFPVKENKAGGLFFGVTRIFPGKVDNEYFMTKGHFHSNSDTAEFYWGIEGEGLLLFMNKDRETWIEKMTNGSLHYIPGNTAHRVINTGELKLSFGACWPSDAGHDYAS
ncbi:Glucose-6-phosphate isomerase [subsurface metagenome]